MCKNIFVPKLKNLGKWCEKKVTVETKEYGFKARYGGNDIRYSTVPAISIFVLKYYYICQ